MDWIKEPLEKGQGFEFIKDFNWVVESAAYVEFVEKINKGILFDYHGLTILVTYEQVNEYMKKIND